MSTPTPGRQEILNAAWRRIAAQGYAETTVAQIAEDLGVDRAQVFAQFPRKMDLVWELYRLLAFQLEERVTELPEGDIVLRFGMLVDYKIGLLSAHGPVMRALFDMMSDPQEELGVMGAEMESMRRRVRGIFAQAAWGATNRPPDAQMPELIRYLYHLHLALVFLSFTTPPKAFRAVRFSLTSLLKVRQFAFDSPFQGALRWVENWLQEQVEPNREESALAERILACIFRHRRLQGDTPCAHKPCPQCMALHRERVEGFIQRGEPILMVLPAFPAKSPNRNKVLGDLPDTAERIALRNLNNLCRGISDLYPPGARLVICSDGHVFGDLVGVTDEQVTRYNAEIQRLLTADNLECLSVFTLEDIFSGAAYEHIRAHELEHYSDGLEELRQRVHDYPVHRHLYDGLHRFLFEDQVLLHPELSRNKVREQCKELTYRVMQRSNAWGRLVSLRFPEALRLSIHPQDPHAEKIGVHIIPAVDNWVTPWHGVAVLRNEDFLLMKRTDAEVLGGRIVSVEGRRMHYEV